MLDQYPNLRREIRGDFIRPMTRAERAKMLIYSVVGFLTIYGSTRLSNPVAENTTLLIGASESVLGVKQLMSATFSKHFPEAAKNRLVPRIETAWNLGRKTVASAINVVRA